MNHYLFSTTKVFTSRVEEANQNIQLPARLFVLQRSHQEQKKPMSNCLMTNNSIT
ncbi:MAG: hypothetical protein WBM86_15030 [Waterburya sp.]